MRFVLLLGSYFKQEYPIGYSGAVCMDYYLLLTGPLRHLHMHLAWEFSSLALRLRVPQSTLVVARPSWRCAVAVCDVCDVCDTHHTVWSSAADNHLFVDCQVMISLPVHCTLPASALYIACA